MLILYCRICILFIFSSYIFLFLLGCRTAPNDLVFILDGSFSVGPDNFEIVKNWIINISSSFEIGTSFTQVGVVQYSDDPVLEILLEQHRSNEDLMEAMETILYRGGNTRTGKAITFGVDNVFATSTRAVNAVTKVAIVLTDGRSQDDVKESAEAARKKKIILFAIGVGQEIEDTELQTIANKPSSTYVFHVKDYTGISRIREIMKQKLCEGKYNLFLNLLNSFSLQSYYFKVQCCYTCNKALKWKCMHCTT